MANEKCLGDVESGDKPKWVGVSKTQRRDHVYADPSNRLTFVLVKRIVIRVR